MPRTIGSLSTSVVVLGALLGACTSSTSPGGSGGPDSGPGSGDGGVACGSSLCAGGELCCAGADVSCTLTCMKVATCPVYGRPCPTDAGPSNDSGVTLRWYTTCGGSICQGPTDDAGGSGTDAGACAAVGATCSTKGETCGTPDAQNCGVIEVCDDHDPKSLGCPVSSRKFKDDIEYLAPAELERLHDETLRMRLATYNYKGQIADPNPKHLGFIVEDAPQSLAVDRGHDRVDMYGYFSMIVATAQVQEREIAELRRELDATRIACEAKSKGR
jgi:hypothetical protein